MSLSLVVAVADNGVIGRDGDLPWRLPGELKYFRRLTMGHTVLMGRRTFDSLPKALDGREMWVLSRDPSFAPSSARRFDTLDAALAAAGSRDLMVIGGASLYAATLPLADTIWLTRVHANPDGDTHLPPLDTARWRDTELERHAADERHAHAYSMHRLDRIAGD